MIHCAWLVCSSATCPSPTPIVQHSHWSPGCSESHPSWGWMSQQYRWFWVSSFLEISVLTSNQATNRSRTGSSAVLTASITVIVNLCSSLLRIKKAIPTSPFQQRPWSTVGFPTLTAHTPQVAELESKPSQCPEEPVFVPDSRACAPPRVLVQFFFLFFF